ncbi:hypothetical protein [Streptomyces sp. CB02959]|uniref:hypothetical protein n=1 Tax=Streptomyces sp. CB02959 TaxID=2020330 RepID=UPI0011AF6DE1|nr:hypothetical protein [Streptomyces sp. CB02959]
MSVSEVAACAGLSFSGFVEQCVMKADPSEIEKLLIDPPVVSGDEEAETVLYWSEDADLKVRDIVQHYAAKKCLPEVVIAACVTVKGEEVCASGHS